MAVAKWATRSRSCRRQPVESCSIVQCSDTFCIHAAMGGNRKENNGTTVQGRGDGGTGLGERKDTCVSELRVESH